jgi:hypothetical protein
MMIFTVIIIIAAFFVGLAIGGLFKRSRYHGVLRLFETENGLIYSLELAEDPELLANHKEVIFKVDAPEYEKLLSR